ncbi:MAG: hypothetical protein HY747_11650 [Elusimicrobia bacterium]|nr:hypothetical protein [Elusimicrobiota bacterium]
MAKKISQDEQDVIPYKTLLRLLYRYRVRYLVAGGVAVIFQGYQRFTKDIDFMLAPDAANILKFVRVLKKLGYRPIIPVKPEQLASARQRKKWAEEKGAVAFHFLNPSRPWDRVDVFLKNPIPFAPAFRKRKEIPVADFKINVIALDDLIYLKKKAGRPDDLLDIDRLKRVLYRQSKE